MTIDIDKLTEAELIELNHRIVARLRLIAQMRAHVGMMEFRVGERVAFDPPGHGRVEGVLTRYNKKTVTVLTEDGRQWNVSPQLLSRADPGGRSAPIGPDMLVLGGR
ncbi:MAG TPA: hypothetical protein VE650_09355 [Acetobacteraceae bacterium]|jgi:hypothetical protein|nr:hypothetical protein [Acetobacteraceae bacterium]